MYPKSPRSPKAFHYRHPDRYDEEGFERNLTPDSEYNRTPKRSPRSTTKSPRSPTRSPKRSTKRRLRSPTRSPTRSPKRRLRSPRRSPIRSPMRSPKRSPISHRTPRGKSPVRSPRSPIWTLGSPRSPIWGLGSPATQSPTQYGSKRRDRYDSQGYERNMTPEFRLSYEMFRRSPKRTRIN